MEYIDGRPLAEFFGDGVEAETKKALAQNGANIVLKQIFEHGFFQQFEFEINLGREFFDQCQGSYEFSRQQNSADRKIVGRPLGLGTIIGIIGNTHRSHGIFFFSKLHG